MSAPAKRRPAPRVAFNLRVNAAGKATYQRIAEHRTAVTGKKHTASSVARTALGEYALKNDPDRHR